MTRDAIIESLKELHDLQEVKWYQNEAIDEAIKLLKNDRPKGHWEEVPDMWGDTLWRCDYCGMEFACDDGTPADHGMLYCPNCGAKMEVEKRRWKNDTRGSN